ncbi:MAG: methyltransferase type 12 [Halochromatium sp.]|nr:methyltransferase type 12 [Halochromatium sp.]
MHWNQEATTPLHEERLEAVLDAVRASSARSLLDLGCGDGDLLVRLAQEPRLEHILGLDLNAKCLAQVRRRLDVAAAFSPQAESNDANLAQQGRAHFATSPSAAQSRSEAVPVPEQRRTRGSNYHQGHRIELRQGSLTTPDSGLIGFDCALLIETIEHINPRDLGQVEQAIFARMCPQTVIITTPNAEYNPLLEVPPNRFRHPDHRFEWDRSRFQRWTRGVAQRHGYGLRHRDIGGVDPVYGGASQMALFQRQRPER